MKEYVISNNNQTTIIIKLFADVTDAVTWCENTQDMSQNWRVDKLRSIVTKFYEEEK